MLIADLLDTVGGQLKGPGNSQGDGEAKKDQRRENFRNPTGGLERGKQDGANLQHNPSHHHLSRGDAEDVAAGQFRQNFTHETSPEPVHPGANGTICI